MPAGSKTDPPLAKAKPISASVITYLRRKTKELKKQRELLQPERGVRRCKKLCRHQGGGVQSGNAHAIASNWGISQANQSSNKCSLAASQDENQKASHHTGVYGYGGSSCTPPGKPPCSMTSLKCVYTNACSMGNKQEELEVCVQSQGHDLIAVTETWWDSSHDWNAVMDGYVLFRRDRLARPPDQEEEVDEAFYRQLEVALRSQALVLMGDLNHPDICWKGNTARHAQTRRFLQSINDNFLTQVVEEPIRREVLLDLVLTKKEGLLEDVKAEGSLGCHDHEMVEFRILRGRSRAISGIRTLDFRRANFGLFKDLLGESHGLGL
ncbi:hypothetical protein GRJ2_002999600 [Grus japonensis]|uniref:Uncharacterized protein n=1 Tax=Grus japonensis TaxID=30415 RepID=A0ABC9Y5N0_GRUJA